MFKKIPNSKKKQVKIVEIITEESEHTCTEKCFKQIKKPAPEGLMKVDLGYIYQDFEGRCYKEQGDNDWLEVDGLTFLRGHGGLHLMFHPTHQLHIHSRGGKTIEKTTVKRDARVTDEFHSIEAAKKHKRKGLNLKESLTKYSSDIKKVIPKAPKRKMPVKGTGRGAPGIPRTEMAREIVKIIGKGKNKKEAFTEIIEWAKTNSKEIAGPHKINIKKQVNRWWMKIKSAHK